MEGVKGNSDRKQDIKMRRLIDDPDPRHEPLEILEQKISVLEEAEHAQIHANAPHQPSLLGPLTLRLADLAAEPEIHRGRREQQRGERRVPCAVENVTGDHEQIFPQLPTPETPVERRYDDVEDDKGERIKKHGEVFGVRQPMAAPGLRQPY